MDEAFPRRTNSSTETDCWRRRLADSSSSSPTAEAAFQRAATMEDEANIYEGHLSWRESQRSTTLPDCFFPSRTQTPAPGSRFGFTWDNFQGNIAAADIVAASRFERQRQDAPRHGARHLHDTMNRPAAWQFKRYLEVSRFSFSGSFINDSSSSPLRFYRRTTVFRRPKICIFKRSRTILEAKKYSQNTSKNTPPGSGHK